MATATAEPTTAQSSTKPLKVFRLRGISASVFANHAKSAGRTTMFHKVSVQRTYKDGDDFKTTTSFGRDELPICMHLMQQAWAFILDAESKRSQDDPE